MDQKIKEMEDKLNEEKGILAKENEEVSEISCGVLPKIIHVCVCVCAFVRTFNWGHAWVFLQATRHTHHTRVMPGFPE